MRPCESIQKIKAQVRSLSGRMDRRAGIFVSYLILFVAFQNCGQVTYVAPKNSSSGLASTAGNTAGNTAGGSSTPVTPAAATPPPTPSSTPAQTPTATPVPTPVPTPAPTPVVPSVSTPFNGAAALIPGKIEAENFDEGGEGVAYHDTTPGNQRGAYRTNTDVDIATCTDSGTGLSCGYKIGSTDAGEWLKYTVNVTVTGLYSIIPHLSTTEAGRTLHIEVDNVDVTGEMIAPTTGSFDSWADFAKTGVALTAGSHVIKVVWSSGWIDLDYITVKTDPTPFYNQPFSIPGATIQAEDFDNGGEGLAYHDVDAGNSFGQFYRITDVDIKNCTDTGGGFAVGRGNTGEWLIYSINVTQPGTYRFDARLATADSNVSIHVEIDGVNVTGSVAVPYTSWWDTTYATISSSGIQLSGGRHQMRVVIDSGFVDFNYFNLVMVP
jgi:hypothetical protein